MPAGIELEVAPTKVVTDSGCDGVGASLDDEPQTYTTGEPVDTGAHNKCLAETLAPPDSKELYGVTIEFCQARSSGFNCKGTLAACPEQSVYLDVRLLLFGAVPVEGSSGTSAYSVSIAGDAQGGCPRVACEQEFVSVQATAS